MWLPDENKQATGIMFANGEAWINQKRFVLKTLRNFGFGKASMEEVIKEEVSNAVENLKQIAGLEPVVLFRKINVYIVNALWFIISNKRLDYDDPKLEDIVNKINALMTSVSSAGMLDVFPWLQYVAPESTGYTALQHGIGDVLDISREVVDEHKNTFDVRLNNITFAISLSYCFTFTLYYNFSLDICVTLLTLISMR